MTDCKIWYLWWWAENELINNNQEHILKHRCKRQVLFMPRPWLHHHHRSRTILGEEDANIHVTSLDKAHSSCADRCTSLNGIQGKFFSVLCTVWPDTSIQIKEFLKNYTFDFFLLCAMCSGCCMPSWQQISIIIASPHTPVTRPGYCLFTYISAGPAPFCNLPILHSLSGFFAQI